MVLIQYYPTQFFRQVISNSYSIGVNYHFIPIL